MSKSWLRDGVFDFHSALSSFNLQMVLSGHHNGTLHCVFWGESLFNNLNIAIDTFYYRYSFITNFLHLYTVDIFPGTLEWYRCGNSWQTTWIFEDNGNTHIGLIQYSRQTFVRGKLSKNHNGSFKYSKVGSMSFWCATSTSYIIYVINFKLNLFIVRRCKTQI